MSRVAAAPPKTQAESSTAGSKVALRDFNVDEAVKFLESLKPLRDLLPNLHAKMSWVAGQAERIPKRGQNKDQGYEFATESDIVTEVTKYAFIAGLSIEFDYFKPRFEWTKSSTNRDQQHCYLGAYIIVTDVVTQASTKRRFFGYARDTSDKAIWKAKTGCKKYAYAQTFGITTGDDPEAHPTGDEDFVPSNQPPQGNVRPINGRGGRGNAGTATSPADNSAQERAAREQRIAQRRALYNDIGACVGKLVEMRVIPEDEKERAETLLKLFRQVVDEQAPSWHEGMKKATLEGLTALLDILNGFIAQKQSGQNVDTAKIPCDACQQVDDHAEGCPNAPLDEDETDGIDHMVTPPANAGATPEDEPEQGGLPLQ